MRQKWNGYMIWTFVTKVDGIKAAHFSSRSTDFSKLVSMDLGLDLDLNQIQNIAQIQLISYPPEFLNNLQIFIPDFI